MNIFLDKFFPASRAAGIRRDICGIKQRDTETLHQYWERFKRLCASCPQHGIPEQALIQYFYEGLLPMERRMMDAASGGAIVNKTPQAARDLILKLSNLIVNIFLSNGLSQSFENGMLEEGKESSIYRWNK